METKQSQRNAQVLWNYYQDGIGTIATAEPLLGQQSVVRVGHYPKRFAKSEVQITPKVLEFFE